MIIGKNVGPYRILAKTRLGETGVVYKAVHTGRRQTYGLKLLTGHLSEADPKQRPLTEKLRIASELDHPNIARTYPLEYHNALTLIPLEFVYGQPVSDKITGGMSPPEFILKMALQAAQALQQAHIIGLVHGRITTNNLIISADGDLKILDFALDEFPIGLCFADDEADSLMNCLSAPPRPPLSRFAYLAPEQVRGGTATAGSDLFAVGVILYELLVGEFLFEGDNREELFRQIQERDLPRISDLRPGLSPGWSNLISGLLEKNPQHRYPSASALLEDLRKLNYGIPLKRLSFQSKDPPISRRSFFLRFRGELEDD